MAHSTEDQGPNEMAEEPTVHAVAVTEEAQIEAGSDGEGERAARERLKKTSIAGLAQKSNDANSSNETHPLSHSVTMDTESPSGAGSDGRGRPAKKRSFEDLTRGDSNMEDTTEVAEQPLPKSGHHKRMRSRDVASGEHVISKFEADTTNSVREESDIEAQKSPGGPGILVDTPAEEGSKPEGAVTVGDAAKPTSDTEAKSTEAKLNAGQPQSTVKSSSGFANTSSTSPFGASVSKPQSSLALGATESKARSTSPSAFASSGLSAFGSSEKSPFGAATSKSTGGFGGLSPAGGFGSSSSGGFGNASTASPFAPKPSSGFGGGGAFGSTSAFGASSGFGATKPFGSGLSSSGTFGTGKPFATAKDDDEEGSENDGDEEDEQDKDATQDERFHEQDVETGEEEEDTIFVCRAKLYHFESEWKERGVGTFKINVRYVDASLPSNTSDKEEKDAGTRPEENEKTRDFSGDDIEAGPDDSFVTTERRARLLMRTDGVHRVILNTPVFKDMHVGERDGSEPSGKTMHLTGLEEGKLKSFQIKIGKEDVIKDLYWKVVELRTDLS